MVVYAVFDIGGTAIKHGLLNEDGKFVTKSEVATEAQLGGQHILETVLKLVEEYNAHQELLGVGISTAGIVNSDTGEIIFVADHFPKYGGINFKKTIEEKFALPCKVENDVNSAGLAENMVGAASGSSCALVMTIGTGIGGCLIINNNVYPGYSYSACEVGQMYLDGERFEKQAAVSIVVKRVAEAKAEPVEEWNGKRIFQEAKAGDVICCRELDRMVDILARGIANACYVVNPEVVVLGGGIMAQQEYLEERINKALDKYLLASIREHTRLAFAKLKNDAGMLGAYYNLRKFLCSR